MKKVLLAGIVVALSACSSGTQGDNNSDSAKNADTMAHADGTKVSDDPNAISSVCFLNTEGKDSTTVELVVKGEKVTGQMNWLPYEKDARKGKLEGKLRGDTIRATWSFMQEGTTDTLGVVFLMKDNANLAQKPLKLNEKTGRQQTDEGAGFTVKFEPHAVVKK